MAPASAGPLRGLVAGAGAVPRAFGLLRRERSLWGLCVLPLLSTLILFVVAGFVYFGLLLEPLQAMLHGWMALPAPEVWYAWLWIGPLRVVRWALGVLLGLAFFGLVYVLFLAVGGIVAAPFLDALSRRVERLHRGGVRETAEGWRAALRGIREEARRVAFLMIGALLVAGMGLVPGLQLPALVAGVLFGAFFLPLEYTGFVLDRRAVAFAVRRAWLWRHRWTMLGFGGAALLTCVVPVLNFLCLPVLVTAGTRLALDLGPPADGSRGASSGA